MNDSTQHATTPGIVFANLAGNAQLFEKLGDAQAKTVISQCLNQLVEATTRHDGRVISTVGDEIMSLFPDANHMIKACIAMQNAISSDTVADVPMAVRIGAYTGPVLSNSNGEVYGDTVNNAKRMSDIARANQIITGESTQAALSQTLQHHLQPCDQLIVKSTDGATRVFEVNWITEEDHHNTVTLGNSAAPPAAQPDQQPVLVLTWMNRELRIALPADQRVTLGRGDNADHQMGGKLTSRIHLSVYREHQDYLISDQSTNGTYIRPDAGRPFFLRREAGQLSGSGLIGLGNAPEDCAPEDLVRFEVR